MKDLFDVRHPIFLPLWRRVALTAFAAVWACVEFISGNPFWALLFGMAALYLFRAFFVVFDPEEYVDRS